MRLTAAGLLGLGTSSPGTRLEVYTTGTYGTAYQPAVYITNDSSGGTVTANTGLGAIAWATDNNSTVTASIEAIRQNPSTGAASALAFRTGSSGGGTERVRITSAGNVGIGTTSPVEPLDVIGSAVFGNTGTANQVLFRRPVTGNPSGFIGYPDATDNALFAVQSGGGSAVLRLNAANSLGTLQFQIDSTERARIDSSGRLLVGTSTSLSSTSLIQAYKSSGTLGCLLDSDSLSNSELVRFQAIGGDREVTIGVIKHSGITNPCAYIELQCEDAAYNYLWADNSDILSISTNSAHIGTTSGTVVGAQTSDERIKNILGPVNYGLDEIKQLDPVSYALKSDPEQVPHLGFIAQQVNPIIPESIFDTDDHIEGEPEDAPTKLGMEYVALIPVLVNAIKELSAEVDALKVQLQAS
jgi:hypothetical protein